MNRRATVHVVKPNDSLVDLDSDYTTDEPAEGWEDWYAAQLVERFGA